VSSPVGPPRGFERRDTSFEPLDVGAVMRIERGEATVKDALPTLKASLHLLVGFQDLV
jgi:hypothetical protein